ncbi:UBX domain protein [Teladorsagia circumcincta]|uniref:UBX domain protein n=1 Tax=Teladorsagia circumcincta TaxID=45464 RepID=A0A2G9U0E6_TELCI|nr:UBX domain protein [Teladorsagia circumcincta]
MSTVVDQLVDMGFERARAEYAYAQTGNGALEQEARKAKASGLPPPERLAPNPTSTTSKPSNPAPKTDYKEAMIQVRLPSGQAVRQSFGASEPLSAVRLWLEINHSDGMPFGLLVPFPRKVMTDEDYDKPLKELGLVPSANFVMTR